MAPSTRIFWSNEEVSVAGERLDLYEAFKALCLDEEEFRNEIAKYRDDPEMTPEKVPPLVPSHLASMLPVARNKMYYAEKVFQNFSGDYIERTVAPADKTKAARNSTRAVTLMEAGAIEEGKFSYKGEEGKVQKIDALFGVRTHEQVMSFLEKYEWQTSSSALAHELRFLKGDSANPEIKDWLFIAPQLKDRAAVPWPDIGGFSPAFTVKERARIGERFKVYSESTHVNIAKHIAGCKALTDPNPLLAELTRQRGRAVLLFYPVTNDKDRYVTVGFALQLPQNSVVGNRKWVTR